MSEQKELGRALIKSFIAVACGVLVATLGYFLAIALIIAVFYPEHAKQMAQDRNQESELPETERKNADQEAPIIELPDSLFAVCPFLRAIAAWGGGYLAARLAPAARMGHGLLVAGVLLFNSIQLLLDEDPALPGWLISLNTFVGPACALWGAAVAEKFAPHPNIDDESPK